MRTWLVFAEPVTYVGDDVNSNHVLVPNDFLSLNPNKVVYNCCSEGKDKEYQPNTTVSNAEKVLKVWKRGQQRLKQFWELWRNEYLLNLRERAQMSLKGPKRLAHNSPQVGDVVVIKENLPRGRWRVGVIHELVRGKDQMIRSAQVLISPNKYLHRALGLLYPIECPGNESMQFDRNGPKEQSRSDGSNVDAPCDKNQEDSDHLSDNWEGDKETNNKSRAGTREVGGRAVRQASVAAKKRMREWLNPTDSFVCVGSVAIHCE